MKKQEWFETWFDTPYYHLLYENRDESEAENFIRILLQYLRLPSGGSVLDVACGTGRYTMLLAEQGFNTIGIDLSYKNIQEAGNFEHENLSFYVHDMRESFYVNYFDAVFNFFTSFGYFSSEKDNLKAIRAASNSLKPGGRLVIDFFNAENAIRELIPEQQIFRKGVIFTVSKSLEGNIIVKKVQVKDQEKEYSFEERVQALSREDFVRYFQRYHLILKDVFGNYRLESFDDRHSERMILIAEKVRT